MKSWKRILSVIAILAVMGGVLYGTGAFASDQGDIYVPTKAVSVGGLPVIVSFSVTSFTPEAAADIDTVEGFVPDYVYVVDDVDSTGAFTTCEWFRGMAADTAVVTADNGDRTWASSGGITVSSGHISLAVGSCQQPEGVLKGWAFRYSQ